MARVTLSLPLPLVPEETSFLLFENPVITLYGADGLKWMNILLESCHKHPLLHYIHNEGQVSAGSKGSGTHYDPGRASLYSLHNGRMTRFLLMARFDIILGNIYGS